MKRLLAAILAITMVFGTASVPGAFDGVTGGSAIIAEAESYGDFEYDVWEDGTIAITRYTGSDTELVIPSEIDGMAVMAIGYSAFYDCTSLTSVTIPDSVTSIGEDAFRGCTSLTNIDVSADNTEYSSIEGVLFNKEQTELLWYPEGKTDESYAIPNSVTAIGYCAFYCCDSLTSVTIPDSVTSIGEFAFGWCTSLTSVTIPDSVTSIDYGAFVDCTSLTSVTIPASVETIGTEAFGYYYDEYIDEYVKDSNFKIYCYSGTAGENYAIENEFYYEFVGYGYYVLDDGTIAISGYNGSDTELVIPSEIDGMTVTAIGYSAFEDCTSLTSVSIPDSVTEIGEYAFSDCTSLTSVTISDSVTSIGECAFLGCTSLTSVTIPDSVTSIGSGAFDDTAIVNNQTTEISYVDGWVVDADESITQASIANGARGIADYAFYCCDSLTSVTIPDSVTSIGEMAFSYCDSLTSVTIPGSVTSIGWNAFSGCTSLTSITISDGVTSIGSGAFSGCTSLTSITISDGVTSIGSGAFSDCTSLTSVDIPDSVTSIDWGAFSNTAIVNNQTTEISYVDGWVVEAAGIITQASIANGTRGIANGVFNDFILLTSVTIPDSVIFIGDYAFWDCISLTSVDIPDSVISIGEIAFEYCTSLTSVTIPDSMTEISYGAFSGCTSLTSVTIPESVTKVGYRAFDGCTSLKSVTIPASVEKIGETAFGYYYDWDIDDYAKVPNFKIYCYSGTAGEQYAIDNGFDYVLIDDVTDSMIGEVELTGSANVADLAITATDSEGKTFEATVAEDGSYSFADLAEGEYTVTVSCENCVSRSYNIKIGSTLSVLDTSLKLYGDINGDGDISILDIVKANAAVKGTSSLDEYDSKVADVNSDGKLSIVDVVKMNAHMKGKASLW